MSNSEHSLEDFLGDDIAALFDAGTANVLEDGKYRWAIKEISFLMGQRNGAPWKKIAFKGINADTGGILNRERNLTLANGTVNTVALTMLGEQMARAGIRKNIKELLTSKDPLPVVTLNVSTRVGGDNVSRQDWSIEVCADQNILEVPF